MRLQTKEENLNSFIDRFCTEIEYSCKWIEKKVNPFFMSLLEEKEFKYFTNLKSELDRIGQEHTFSQFHWASVDAGGEAFKALEMLYYREKLGWITTLFHLYEQHCFIFLNQAIKWEGKRFDDNFQKSPTFIKEAFKQLNIEVEKFEQWESLKELRLLTNVIKHGYGKSSTELRELNPDLFLNIGHCMEDNDNASKMKRFDLFKNVQDDEALDVNIELLLKYKTAIISFWGSFIQGNIKV